MAHGPTLEQPRPSPDNPILDPDEGDEHEIHFNTVLPYEGQYVMLYEYGRYEPWFNALLSEIRLATGRDLAHTRRLQSHRPVVALGEANEWDADWRVARRPSSMTIRSGSSTPATGASGRVGQESATSCASSPRT